MENRVILITGGCRSGKSRFALDYADRRFSKKIYLATAEVLDEEMAFRVENHRKARGPEWQTVEEPLRVVEKIMEYGDQVEAILFDCLTLWLSNLLLKWEDDSKIMDEVERLTKTLKQIQATLILVTNEVGMGIVPDPPSGPPIQGPFRNGQSEDGGGGRHGRLHGLGNPPLPEGCSVTDFIRALSFLTILPIGRHLPQDEMGLARSMAFYPLVRPCDRRAIGPGLLPPLPSASRNPSLSG